MEQVANHLSTFQPGSLPEPVQRAVEPLSDKQISLVFQRLQAQLGAKLADLYAGVPPAQVRTEWAGALGGFADAEIMRGLDACRTRIFAPNLGEFLNLCRPALDPEIAWLEACDGLAARAMGTKGEWSHPAVFRTAVSHIYEVRNKSFKECRKGWSYALQREFARGWLKDVPDAPQQLGHEPAKVRPPNAQERQKIDAILGRKAPTEGATA